MLNAVPVDSLTGSISWRSVAQATLGYGTLLETAVAWLCYSNSLLLELLVGRSSSGGRLMLAGKIPSRYRFGISMDSGPNADTALN